MQAFGEAKTCARQAIELDGGLSEAHAALSLAEAFCDYNLAEALWQGERALELNPDSAIARYAYAQTLSACGRLDEALEQATEGCAIDPLMAPINYCYGLILYYQHRWDEADAQLQRTLEIAPNFLTAQAVRGIVLARSGRFSEAMAQIHELLNKEPRRTWELLLAYVSALAGEHEEAESIFSLSLIRRHWRTALIWQLPSMARWANLITVLRSSSALETLALQFLQRLR